MSDKMNLIQEIEAKGLLKRNTIREAILSGESQVQKFYDDAVVFVTGGTGFIGKQLIEKLLRSSNIRKMYILLRPKKGKSINERLKIILQDPVYNILHSEKRTFADKIVAVEGDVSALNLGIDEKKWSILTDEINIIFHVAATINFEETVKKAALTNVRGTREMLKLARDCKNIKAIVHVSTAYAHARRSLIKNDVKEDFCSSPISPDTLIELSEEIDEKVLNDMIAPLMTDWPNSYTFTKAVTEELLRKYASDLPICIVRPAIVISAYREPEPGWVDTKNVFGPSGIIVGVGLGASHTMLAKQDIAIDFVPVDIVNNVLIASAWETFIRYSGGDKHTLIYTVTSARQPLTWKKISNVINYETKELMTSKCVWYCFVLETQYKVIYLILTWLLHYIPGVIVDGCLLLMGQKPRFFKTYKLVYAVSSVFVYFTNNDWIFYDENTIKLYNSFNDIDKVIYNCNMSNVNVNEMVILWCYGVRKYILKDDMESVAYAIKKQFWLKIAHYIFFPLYIYSLYKTSYFVGNLFGSFIHMLNFMM